MREKMKKDELDLEVYTNIKMAEKRFNGQFFTKAAKKEAMRDLNHAYYLLRGEAFNNFADAVDREELYSSMTNGMPYDLHLVREAKHKDVFEQYGDWEAIAELVHLRAFYNSQEVVAKPKAVKSEGHRTERSAKHWGHCQLCGRKHKLDVSDNTIADHGYTVDGWRSAGCDGSFCLPIELSCEEVKKEISRIKKDLAEYQEMERKGEKVVEGKISFGSRSGEIIYGEPSNHIRRCEHKIELFEKKVANWKPVAIEDLEEVLYDDDVADTTLRLKETFSSSKEARKRAEELKLEGWRTRVWFDRVFREMKLTATRSA